MESFRPDAGKDEGNSALTFYDLMKAGGNAGADKTASVRLLFDPPNTIDLGKLGFPQPDMTGFDQAPLADPNEGTFDKLWRGVKGLVGYNETISDKVREKVLTDLTPEERRKYQAEEEAIKEYRRLMTARSTMLMVGNLDWPKMPETPMHAEVQKRVSAVEKAITEKVRSEMSPHDQERLDQKMDEYARDYREATRIKNPAGTGEGFKRPPRPPAAITDYYERVAEAADRYLRTGNV